MFVLSTNKQTLHDLNDIHCDESINVIGCSFSVASPRSIVRWLRGVTLSSAPCDGNKLFSIPSRLGLMWFGLI